MNMDIMRSIPIKLLGGTALEIGNYLVIADLHIGYSAKLVAYSTQAKKRLVSYEIRYINQLLSLTDKKNLILLGDIKEHISIPPKYIRTKIITLLEKLSTRFKNIIITRGNHDGNLAEILDTTNNTNIKIADYVTLKVLDKKVILTHGHIRLPKNEVTSANLFIIGHLHPASITGEKIPVSLLVKFKNAASQKQIIILPAVNPRLNGIPIGKVDITAQIKRIIGSTTDVHTELIPYDHS